MQNRTFQETVTETFRKYFLEAFPHWVSHLKLNEDVLEAEIPSPNSGKQRPLFLSTDDCEITVSYDRFHCHFTSYSFSEDVEEVTREAIEFITELVTDQIAVVVAMKAGEWQGSRYCSSNEIEKYLNELQEGYFVSWSGKFGFKNSQD